MGVEIKFHCNFLTEQMRWAKGEVLGVDNLSEVNKNDIFVCREDRCLLLRSGNCTGYGLVAEKPLEPLKGTVFVTPIKKND